MKTLWLTNVRPQGFGSSRYSIGGGWISGALESVRKEDNIEIFLAYPLLGSKTIVKENFENVTLLGFAQRKKYNVLPSPSHRLSVLAKRHLREIVDEVEPDILHVFGTESAHSRYAIECFSKPERTIIHVQGLVSVIVKHCEFGIPFWVRHMIVPSFPARGTLRRVKNRFNRAGKDEIVAIKGVNYVMGRTEWDEACTKAINPSVNYIHCGESLRSIFYEESSQWVYEECKKHTIYFSQSSSQVKGLHLVLPILPQLIKQFPDVHLYIGGNSPIGDKSFKSFMMRSSYGWYLKHLIKKYKLHNHVTFLGPQSAEQVVQNLKNAHVFLSASLIENSPNSVGEAMIVGTPVVSSDVGGVKDFINHGRNGFIYPMDAPYMIPYYVGRLFDDFKQAISVSAQARKTSNQKYNPTKNGEAIYSCYRDIRFYSSSFQKQLKF